MSKSSSALRMPSKGTVPPAASPTLVIDKREATRPNPFEQWTSTVMQGMKQMSTDPAFRADIDKNAS